MIRSSDAGVIGSHRFMTSVSHPEVVDRRWAALYPVRRDGSAQLERASPGSAGRNRTLAVSRLRNIAIRAPSPETQARVVQAVDRLRELDALSARPETLSSALIHAILNAAFNSNQ